MRYVCLLAVMLVLSAPVLSAQDGAAIYKERCASCHDMPEGRAPALSTIKAMSGEAIFIALTSGAMKTQAEGLSVAQIFTLLGHIAPTGGAPAVITPTCKTRCDVQKRRGPAGMDGAPASPTPDSRMPDRGPHGFDRAEAQTEVGVQSGRGQHRAIAADRRGRTRVHPVRDRSRVLARRGHRMHALGIQGECRDPIGSRRRRVTVVFFGDSSATVFALNAETGKEIWKIKPGGSFHDHDHGSTAGP